MSNLCNTMYLFVIACKNMMQFYFGFADMYQCRKYMIDFVVQLNIIWFNGTQKYFLLHNFKLRLFPDVSSPFYQQPIFSLLNLFTKNIFTTGKNIVKIFSRCLFFIKSFRCFLTRCKMAAVHASPDVALRSLFSIREVIE